MPRRRKDRRGAQHYKEMEIEPFEVMRSMGMLYEYCVTAAVKYTMRHVHNDDYMDDLRKARHCLDVAIRELEQGNHD